MTPATLAPAPRWRRFALVLCMFLITATVGFLQPFVPLYLEAGGLTRGQIGLVSGLGAGLALLVQPLLGRLSDLLDSRRPLMALAALSAGLAYLSYRAAHGLAAFLLLSAIGINGAMYLNAVGGVLVGRMVGGTAGGGRTYAGYRVWGSVGYILVTLLTGWLVSHVRGPGAALSREVLNPVFAYGPLLFFAIAAAALFVPDRKNALAAPLQAHSPSRQRQPLPHNLRAFLLAFCLYEFALYGASAFLSLYLKSLHASPLWITGTFAAGVVCEVLVMTRVGRFTDTYGRRPALALAFLVMPLRLLFYIPATGPLWVLLVQTLHGLNFGIMGAIAVVFVNDSATEWERGAAQARLAAAGGLATALGPAVCGWIAGHFGMGWMFAAMSAMGAVAAGVFLTQVQESHPSPSSLVARGPACLHPLLRLLCAPPTRNLSAGG